MANAIKLYVTGVITAGVAVGAVALLSWRCDDPYAYLVLLALALGTSLVKLKLPGVDGSYSLNFLFILFSVDRFSFGESVLLGCAAAFLESAVLMRRRLTPAQIAFNVANLAISVAACHAVAEGLIAGTMDARPALGLTLVAAVFFVVNTLLVSGVLALLTNKPLSDVGASWYQWALPYFVPGVALVGAFPMNGGPARVEFWLALVPALYLVHFFWTLSRGMGHKLEAAEATPDDGMSPTASGFVWVVLAAGGALAVGAVLTLEPASPRGFAAYALAVAIAAGVKVPLPGLTGTISLSFAVLLAGCTELTWPEIVLLSVEGAVIQSIWRAEVRPAPIQIAFNATVLAVAAAVAQQIVAAGSSSVNSPGFFLHLGLAAMAMYTINTVLVATVCCLIANRPLSAIWQSFCFWTMPYYLVGAGFAGLIAISPEGHLMAVWMALPLMALIAISYRLHLRRATTA